MSIKPMPDSIEEVYENPSAYGVPTFDEFRTNKRKWMGSGEETLESVDRGDPLLDSKHKYFIEGYRADSLAHAQRLAREMGLSLENDCELRPQVVTDESGRLVTEVRFLSKRTIARRAAW